MELDQDKIIGLPTITQSGQFLGKVKGVEVDPGGQRILYFFVRPALLRRLLCQQFIIHRDQVVKLTEKELIVDDASIKTPVSVFKKAEFSASK